MDCFIFDIDGTLADGSHRIHHIQKSPKDWDTYFSLCGEDSLIEHVAIVCKALHRAGFAIVYVSGRSSVCLKDTIDWLRRHKLPDGPIYMRQAGDRKDDNLLKIELLAELRSHGYRPLMVFDDRDRVVKAWREAGLPCAQVAPGDF